MTTTQDRRTTTGASWDRLHARTAALREVIAILDDGGPLRPPPSGPDGCFDDEADLLRALHGTWFRRLGGRIDVALEPGTDSGDGDLTGRVAAAWLSTARDLPGVRRLLDERSDDPALRAARRTEHRTLAVAAGLAGLADPVDVSAERGARFVAGLSQPAVAAVPSRRWWRRLSA